MAFSLVNENTSLQKCAHLRFVMTCTLHLTKILHRTGYYESIWGSQLAQVSRAAWPGWLWPHKLAVCAASNVKTDCSTPVQLFVSKRSTPLFSLLTSKAKRLWAQTYSSLAAPSSFHLCAHETHWKNKDIPSDVVKEKKTASLHRWGRFY